MKYYKSGIPLIVSKIGRRENLPPNDRSREVRIVMDMKGLY